MFVIASHTEGGLFRLAQCVILVIDSTDRERLGTSKEELYRMLAHEVCSRLMLVYVTWLSTRGGSLLKYSAAFAGSSRRQFVNTGQQAGPRGGHVGS